MKSATLPSFWAAYESLDEDAKRSARKAYRLWAQNPFHPSLHFKCMIPLQKPRKYEVIKGNFKITAVISQNYFLFSLFL